tara:strand:+ start:260 stop:649 length:390 start_codon:yes stop_codon:yes gene_type:complete
MQIEHLHSRSRSEIAEDMIIERVVQAVFDAGSHYRVRVNYGEGDRTKQLTDTKAVIASLRACDEEWLDVETRDDASDSWLVSPSNVGSISLIYSNGNDGADVISDYTGRLLEKIIGPVIEDLISTFDRW